MKRKPLAFALLGLLLIGFGTFTEDPRGQGWGNKYAFDAPTSVDHKQTYCADAACLRARALRADWNGAIAAPAAGTERTPAQTYTF